MIDRSEGIDRGQEEEGAAAGYVHSRAASDNPASYAQGLGGCGGVELQ